jgi:hypothetical protein
VSRRASAAAVLAAAGAVAAARSLRPALERRGGPTVASEPVPAPPPIPAGWTIAPPDFVGVGTTRAGTTWWDALIHAHPGVARAGGTPKEIHFFDRFWKGDCSEADLAAYHAYFPRPAGAIAGEWTPGYLGDPWIPPLLRRAAPDARLLVLLRDPVERFRSERATAAAGGSRAGAPAIPPRVAANAAFGRGLYADQLLRLWRAFPREQVLVLQLERCVREPDAQLRRTFAFLGLDPSAADAIDAAAAGDVRRGPRADLTLEQQTTLIARYAPENARLAALLGDDLDLSLWTAAR